MTSKPELFARIEKSFSQHTPSEKRVAGWLLAHAAQIPFETADGIARATGTSGITVGRYLRKLGFRNLEDAKASLRELPSVPYQPWGMNERLDSWQQQQQQRLPDRARQSLSLEIDAITHVYQLAQSETFLRIAQQLAHAEAVYVLGIQSTRGIANAFFSHLEYLRPKVSYSEGLSGSWVESLNSGFARPYVVITDTRAYSAAARQYCRVASGHFWDSLAPVSCLFNLLLSGVVDQLGDTLAERLRTNRQLQQEFGQFEQ